MRVDVCVRACVCVWTYVCVCVAVCMHVVCALVWVNACAGIDLWIYMLHSWRDGQWRAPSVNQQWREHPLHLRSWMVWRKHLRWELYVAVRPRRTKVFFFFFFTGIRMYVCMAIGSSNHWRLCLCTKSVYSSMVGGLCDSHCKQHYAGHVCHEHIMHAPCVYTYVCGCL